MPNYYYNGVALPELPEWDKTTYPYVYIWQKGVFGVYGKTYTVVVSAVRLSYISSTQWGCKDTFAFATSAIDTSASSEWSEFEYKKSTLKYEESIAKPIWCNADILKTDGSVYLPASDPVPVEPEQPEPTPQDFYIVKNGVGQKQDVYLRVGGQWVKQDEYLI